MDNIKNTFCSHTKLSPIALFVYKRPLETKQTLDALKNNYLAPQSHLFIFSDGPHNESDISKVKEVRDEIKRITGFRQVTIFESETNKGLANSVISGVTSVLTKYNKVIVLEEDLITSPNFLDFLNQALDFYASKKWAFSVSGYTLNLPSLKTYSKDYYLGYRASSWGWGTWKDRWKDIDWEICDYKRFRFNPLQQIRFMRGGSDMPRMLSLQMKGKIDSWAIRWCFNQFQKNMLTVFPTISKISNIGYGDEATHVKNNSQFDTLIDPGEKTHFIFDESSHLEKKLIKEFRNKYSVLRRIKNRLRKIIHSQISIL